MQMECLQPNIESYASNGIYKHVVVMEEQRK